MDVSLTPGIETFGSSRAEAEPLALQDAVVREGPTLGARAKSIRRERVGPDVKLAVYLDHGVDAVHSAGRI